MCISSIASASSLKPTSPASFDWCGTEILKFIGQETAVVIPEGATELKWLAFEGNPSLISVVISSGVEKIGADAFENCPSLESVVLADSVKIIERGAFASCPALKHWGISSSHPCFKSEGIALLTKDGQKLVACPAAAGEYRIPDGVSEIGNAAFWGCDSLTSIVLSDDIRKIGWGAFGRCSALKEWVVSPAHPYFKSDGTALFTKDGRKLIACPGAAGEYRVPDGVTALGVNAFTAAPLTSVILPKGLTRIEAEAFYDCRSLVSVVLPEEAVEIEDWAFDCCCSLKFFTIPKGVTAIHVGTFYGCSSLTSIVIPEGVTRIGQKAFADCTSLKDAFIPQSVTEIDFLAFAGCPHLTIHAPAGSRAEEFAKENRLPFEAE